MKSLRKFSLSYDFIHWTWNDILTWGWNENPPEVNRILWHCQKQNVVVVLRFMEECLKKGEKNKMNKNKRKYYEIQSIFKEIKIFYPIIKNVNAFECLNYLIRNFICHILHCVLHCQNIIYHWELYFSKDTFNFFPYFRKYLLFRTFCPILFTLKYHVVIS